MTLVKICGIRTLDEGRAALRAGADLLGFILWEPSKRYVAPDAAARLVAELRAERAGWRAVGVYVDPLPRDVEAHVQAIGLDYVQLSGHEDAATVAAMPRPTLKALHVGRGDEAAVAETVEANALGASLYLLDTKVDGMYGGTGLAFDWAALRAIGPRCFIAGGLQPRNVGVALRTLAPLGVDVSGGVEYPGGGKDPLLVEQFLEAVRTHDAQPGWND